MGPGAVWQDWGWGDSAGRSMSGGGQSTEGVVHLGGGEVGSVKIV